MSHTWDPDFSLAWILSLLERTGCVQKLQFLGCLGLSCTELVAEGRVPGHVQIACDCPPQIEPLLQSHFLKQGNLAIFAILRSIFNWIGGNHEIQTIERLAHFCAQGLSAHSQCVCEAAFAQCFLASIKRSGCVCQHRLHRITQRLIEVIVVTCCDNQQDMELQSYLWDLVIHTLSRSNDHLNTWLMNGLMSLLIWSMEVAKRPHTIADSEIKSDKLTAVCLQAADMLIVRLDERQCAHLGSDLGLVDRLLFLLRADEKKEEFSRWACSALSILWRLTATSRSNCSRLLFPESGFNGARFLVSFGYNFKDYNKAILSVLGALSNAARFPELRQCLYFSDLFRLVDCALDN